MDSADVLIVGAGPTGLVLALWLARAGVTVRIIDKAAEPGTASRALVVHARTLELYRQLGIADRIVSACIPFDAINMWVRGRHAARAEVGDLGRGLTPYPHLFILPQDEHERLLIRELESSGVRVERSLELVGLDESGDGVTARAAGAGPSTLRARYVVGCDGAHSRVRELLGIGFPGGTYERVFYVADVEASRLMDKELHVALDEADFAAVFPLEGEGRGRLIGTVYMTPGMDPAKLTWDHVSPVMFRHLRLEVTRVNWFSTYRVHHRVADSFRRGRVFLAGDAAHIHSPVGGQGMNTGIGDAVNLAWKLADVVNDRRSAELLDTYEPERIAFARRLVATTDRAFVFVTKNGPIARFVRLHVIPRVLPVLLELRLIRRFMFRTLSQTSINYRHSPLSDGKIGGVHGGDRLPWVENADGKGGDNFTALADRAWHVQVYGETNDALVNECARAKLPVVRFAWRAGMRRAGIVQDSAFLVRPDGYVASAGPAQRFAEWFRFD